MHVYHVLSFWVASAFVYASAFSPKTSLTAFPNLPAGLVYLDDTTTVLYHDSRQGEIHVSFDEGSTFTKVTSIPSGAAQLLIPHPYDNRIVFALGGKENWVTQDRGKTWVKWTLGHAYINMSRGLKSLEFHVSKEEGRWAYIIAYAMKCQGDGWSQKCIDVTWYTKDLFANSHQMLEPAISCKFAHSSKEFKHSAPQDLIFCLAPERDHQDSNTNRLYSSSSFFQNNDMKVEDLGMTNARDAKGVVAFAIVSKFAVTAVKKSDGEMVLYVSVDAQTWSRARFPHSSSAKLKEDGYTILESTPHSLVIDVVLNDGTTTSKRPTGALFVSNSNGTYFVESLSHTRHNAVGYVDFERIQGLEGVGLVNVVDPITEGEVKSLITFDDGRNWVPITPPTGTCQGKKESECSLHLYSVTSPNNYGRIFSSLAPGLVMGVGQPGTYLPTQSITYAQSHTFLSPNGGLSWSQVGEGPYKYEFGDSGGVIVMVDDDEWTNEIMWSGDMGDSWNKSPLPSNLNIRAQGLTTVPDSTSLKFLLLGQVARGDIANAGGRYVTIGLDFTGIWSRQCTGGDMEKWYARAKGRKCLMGHMQFYNRRKPHAECYVGNEFQDPVEFVENCVCEDEDYECDYNYILQDGKCIPAAGPEEVPSGVCKDISQTYMGSSGYRKIPGNTCDGGLEKDKPVSKPCSNAQPGEGEITHTIFKFSADIVQQAYFKSGTTILVQATDGMLWQSGNEGYTWTQPFPGQKFLLFYHHHHSDDRAYLLTDSEKFMWTTDGGRTWIEGKAPTRPNTFGIPVLRFHPNSDYLIWAGEYDCTSLQSATCRTAAFYSTNNGRHWTPIEEYVKNCAWAKDKEIDADSSEIICESYSTKRGNQHINVGSGRSSTATQLELVVGSNYYAKNRRRTVFGEVIGFAKFSEFMIVAAIGSSGSALELQVSLDGQSFANGMFPPAMNPETHAYTILESSTHSLFLHLTMIDPPLPSWGNILKSNSNGTYFGLSLPYVNRNAAGYVDFEKLIGLDGIALVNVVSNWQDSGVSGEKKLQSRITLNDGASWQPLTPPDRDSLGNKYECQGNGCALQIHGYTERSDPRATFSSPSVVGLVMAVGNVGTSLKPYADSDTFISRDAGFTWEEVHKDAHIWEFGDSGSILVMVNDEDYTDHVLFSTNEGKSWRVYKFVEGDGEKIRARWIVTVPSDTSRRFILFGYYPRMSNLIAVHLDFTALTSRQCVLDVDDSAHDDFELWSPSIERKEQCLFGRQMLYHRRTRDANCYIGDQAKQEAKTIQKACSCIDADFECEYNHVKNDDGKCVLHDGAHPLPHDQSCQSGEEYWYERTPYRKISYSSCDGGERPDRGKPHDCPGFTSKSGAFWFFVVLVPFGFCAFVGWWYYKKSGMTQGTIRLPGDISGGMYRGNFSNGSWVDTIASVPWFLVGIGNIAYEWIASRLDSLGDDFRPRRGYRNFTADEDAPIVRFQDDED